MAKTLTKGSRITGAPRDALGSQFAKRYAAGESIRTIAADSGRSFGFVHGVLKESGAALRGRGGATRGAKKAIGAPAKKISAKRASAKATTTKSAAKTPVKRAAKKTTRQARAANGKATDKLS